MSNRDIRHSEPQATQQRRPPRRKVVDLSFEQHTSFGEWIYNSAVSIVAVIVLLLGFVCAMLFMSFSVEKRPPEFTIEIVSPMEEIPTEQELEALAKEKERLEREIAEQLRERVRNVQSNEMAHEEGGAQSEVFDEETRNMISHIDGILNNTEQDTGGSTTPAMRGDGGEGMGSGSGKGDGKDKNFKGAVTVEYRFDNPERVARGQLFAPAYRAEHSGRVVVEVYINRNGEVKRAKVITSSGNNNLDREALNAARHKLTIFNLNSSAPELQRGTITYIFIAQ